MARKLKAGVQTDNVIPLKKTPGDDAIVAVNLGKMKRAKDEFESANGAYRNVLKHVEAKGIDIGAAKEALKVVKSGKTEEKVAELTKLFEYLYILGHPMEKNQLELFRVEQPRTPGTDKAGEHGRYCGIMGLGMDQNPYAQESDQGQAWIKAWHGGCEERALVMAMEPADGSDLIKGSDEDDDGDDEVEWEAADQNTAAE